MSPPARSGAPRGNSTDERLLQWARQTATESCDADCRLASTLSHWDSSREETDDGASRVCWGCEGHPWSKERGYVRRVWDAMHSQGLPIREVSEHCNLWSVPCPRGMEVRSRGSRCLVGHFAYGVLCFFRWMGEGNQAYALLSLESAMDLAPLVLDSSCDGSFGFTAHEVAENYGRALSAVWHRHGAVPDAWLPATPARRRCRAPEPEPQELGPDAPPPTRRLRAQCLVLAVYPGEEERMGAVVDTYAPLCDSLIFLTASDAPPKFRGYLVVDLRRFYGDLPSDLPGGASGPGRQEDRNTIIKTMRAFEWAAQLNRNRDEKADVVCRLDSDTLFFPQNLLRILHCRNFSADVPWALGHENYLHKHEEPGRLFLSGGNGICLSRAALEVFLANVAAGGIRQSPNPSDWNVGVCINVPGHWDDVVFGVCLAEFGIPVSRWGTDCAGRTLFWPHALARALPGPEQIRPPTAPPRVTWFRAARGEASRGAEADNYDHWRYRAWQHFDCDAGVWLGDFPVSFHGYRDAAEARAVFRAVVERRGGPGYAPRLWSGDFGECRDLLC